MGFLGTAFLFALPLAAAPLLLHLFDRRRQVVIEWGAMQFLLEAASRKTSARKLKQWLLLLFRVLAVAVLVCALARPELVGGWFGSVERSETIFVIDNSMSMSRESDESTLFEVAIERAVATLNELPPGDAVRILLTSPYPVWAAGTSERIDSVTTARIADQLRELKSNNGQSDLLSALFTAVQAEIEPTWQRRRIVLLTDGQAVDWSLSDEAGWQRFREVLQGTPLPTELDVIDLGQADRNLENLAINEVRASRTVVGVEQTFTLVARIQNHGLTQSPACTATWVVNDDVLDETPVPALAGGETCDVVWKHAFSEIGVQSLTCRLNADDRLAPDNSAAVVVEVVNEVPILVLENSPDLAELQRDAFFVQAALGWDDSAGDEHRGVFVPRLVDSQELERIDLHAYRAVVIPNLTLLNAEVIARLKDFVFAGGGLWIALGPRTDMEAFHQHIFADGDGLSPLDLEGLIEESTTGTDAAGRLRHTTLDVGTATHPATAALADAERLDTREVTVEQRFRFVPPPEGEPVSVLVALSNGEPLAVEKFVGRGRVIVQSIPLRLSWSQLARSQAFVVMVQDWLAYLTQPMATRHNLAPGDPIAVHVADTDLRSATLRTPHEDEIELTPDAVGDGFVFRSSRTVLPGEYVLELGAAGDRIPFHVNRAARESNLTRLSSSDEQSLAGLAGLGVNTTSTGFQGTNRTDPLWPYLFMMLIGLMACELLLAGVIARERFGSTPIAETSEQLGSWTSSSLFTPGSLSTNQEVRVEPTEDYAVSSRL